MAHFIYVSFWGVCNCDADPWNVDILAAAVLQNLISLMVNSLPMQWMVQALPAFWRLHQILCLRSTTSLMTAFTACLHRHVKAQTLQWRHSQRRRLCWTEAMRSAWCRHWVMGFCQHRSPTLRTAQRPAASCVATCVRRRLPCICCRLLPSRQSGCLAVWITAAGWQNTAKWCQLIIDLLTTPLSCRICHLMPTVAEPTVFQISLQLRRRQKCMIALLFDYFLFCYNTIWCTAVSIMLFGFIMRWLVIFSQSKVEILSSRSKVYLEPHGWLGGTNSMAERALWDHRRLLVLCF